MGRVFDQKGHIFGNLQYYSCAQTPPSHKKKGLVTFLVLLSILMLCHATSDQKRVIIDCLTIDTANLAQCAQYSPDPFCMKGSDLHGHKKLL